MRAACTFFVFFLSFLAIAEGAWPLTGQLEGSFHPVSLPEVRWQLVLPTGRNEPAGFALRGDGCVLTADIFPESAATPLHWPITDATLPLQTW